MHAWIILQTLWLITLQSRGNPLIYHYTTLLQLSVKIMNWFRIWRDFIVYKKVRRFYLISRKEPNPSQNFFYSHSLNFPVTSSTLSENWVVNNLKSSQILTQLIIVTDNCSRYPYSRTTKLLWALYSEWKLQSCLKLRNFQNPFNKDKSIGL